jgi:hypothetical protein
MDSLHGVVIKVAEQVNAHPVTASVSSIAMGAVAMLQSAQSVASTLIAFVTSIAGLITAVMAVRNAWRNRNKEKP